MQVGSHQSCRHVTTAEGSISQVLLLLRSVVSSNALFVSHSILSLIKRTVRTKTKQRKQRRTQYINNTRYHNVHGGILADEVGYGKTACIIALVATTLSVRSLYTLYKLLPSILLLKSLWRPPPPPPSAADRTRPT